MIFDVLGNPLVSMTIGASITWLAAWYYYKRAGDELRTEARALHTATSAIAYLLEHPNARTEVQRDEHGRVSGLVVNISGESALKFSLKGTLTDGGRP